MRKLAVKYVLAGAAALLVLAAALSFWRSQNVLTVSRYEIVSDKLTNPVRVAQLSDLHDKSFGKDNADLVALVAAQEPDLIFLTGDMANSDGAGVDVVVSLIKELARIAPVYSAPGNTELECGVDTAALYSGAGATVLDRAYADLTVRGGALRIGGLFGYALPGDLPEQRADETAFLEEFQGTDSLKLLLCHMPLAWLELGSLDYWGADLVFCGHAHGGAVRLPLVGGLYAPDQGWFAGRESGVYYSADGARAMVLSRGLGGPFRFNNLPEVCVADIVPAA